VKVVRDSAMSDPAKFGIKSEVDGQDRILPEFLQTLWQEKKVSAKRCRNCCRTSNRS